MTDHAAAGGTTDPRRMLGAAPLTGRQLIAIAICVFLTAIDGFDVLAISFASPGIAREWGIDRAALGAVLSMELIGMAVGSVLLGQVADRIGRRPTVVICLVIMATGMLATTQSYSITFLAVTRLATGLGIGGMLAVVNALVAEYANDKTRSTAVAIMAGGYPMGAIVGGAIASLLLVDHGWRSVFILGAVMTAIALPLVLAFAPEPVGALLHRRPANTLERINRSLRTLGHAAVSALPPAEPARTRTPVGELFAGDQRKVTILLTLGYFLHILTFYFIIKWIPKIVDDMGFPASQAAGVLVWANVGGLAGAIVFSLLSLKLHLRRLLMVMMVISTIVVIRFGMVTTGLASLSSAAALAGFFTNGTVVGLYALMAASFPTSLRAGGTGVVIGVGRGGAALAPMIGGVLFQWGLGLPLVATIMGTGSLIAAIMIYALPDPRWGNH